MSFASIGLGNSHFNVLEITNNSAEGVELSSRVVVTKELVTTTTPIINSDQISLSGTAIISQGNWNYDLILDSQSGNWTLQQDQEVDKNFYLKNSALDLNGKTLTIKGDLIQSGGTMNVNGGTLIVEGDYRIQNPTTDADGNPAYSYSSGILKMTNEPDKILVQGNFVMDSYQNHSSYLTSGELEVQGSFTQLKSYNAYALPTLFNFPASGSHRVLLSGTAEQTVSFATPGSSRSHFNVLEITNSSTEGIDFLTPIAVTGLFQHNNNTYTLIDGSIFADTDGDSIQDHQDTDPETYTDRPPELTVPESITGAAVDADGIGATAPVIQEFLSSAISNDLLDGSSLSITHNAPEIFPLGATTVVFSVTDSGGNTVTGKSTVTINDQTPPQITLKGVSSITVKLGDAYTDTGASALDNVDGDLSENIQIAGSVDTGTVGLYTLTYTISDSAGNAAMPVTRSVSVQDGDAPVVIPPANITVAATDAEGTVVDHHAIATLLAAATAHDNVDGVITDISHNAPTMFPIGVTKVTFSATDNSGNTGNAQSTVTVADQSGPVIALNGNGSITLNIGDSFTDAGATAIDNVDGNLSGSVQTSSNLDTHTVGLYTLTYTVSDMAGNASAPVTRSVSVQDGSAPVVIPPANLTIAATDAEGTEADHHAIATFLAAVTAHDNVDGVITDITHNAPDIFSIGVTKVTFSATDNSGHTGNAQATVTVADQSGPVITLNGSHSVTLNVDDSFTDEGATAIDNVDGDLSGSIQIDSSVDTHTVGLYTLTYTVSDMAGNASAPVTRSVSVQDRIAPVIISPANLTIAATDAYGTEADHHAIATFLAAATAYDNVDGIITDISHNAPTMFPIGAITVIFSATDNSGNTGNAQATVTVVSADIDNDGLPNDYEIANGLDPDNAGDEALDMDGDGLTNLEEFQSGTNISVDNVPPILVVPDDIEIDSIGALTAVHLGTASAHDFKDGVVVPVVNYSGPFSTGHHELTWSVTDSSGNTVTDKQIVDVVPMVNFAPSQSADEGSDIIVRVLLNGPAATYPVTIPYTIGGTSENPLDHNLIEGAVVISSGTHGTINCQSARDDVQEETETIVISMGTPHNAISGSVTKHIVTIKEENIAPVLNLTIRQGGKLTTTIATDGGDVRLSVDVTDPNPDDTHAYDWSGTDTILVPDEELTSETYTFSPEYLPEGFYGINLIVTDSGNPELNGSANNLIKVVISPPVLSNNNDSDGDGFTDAEEGMGDSDMDRIPNYLDSITELNYLPAVAGFTGLIQGEPGMTLRLGKTSFASEVNHSSVSFEDIKNHGGESGEAVGNAKDNIYTYPCGIFDFEILGLQSAGDSTKIVIPLDEAIPQNAEYRKYTPSTGWTRFVEDNQNTISSAPGTPDACPAPGDTTYSPGLKAGNYCVQLIIEDGGPNDTDGLADGMVCDPGGIAQIIETNNESEVNSEEEVSRGEEQVSGGEEQVSGGGGGGGCFVRSLLE